jgi:hypothetical protein
MLAARVLLPASFFNSRTSFAVQIRLFIVPLPIRKMKAVLLVLIIKLDLDQIANSIFTSRNSADPTNAMFPR